MPTTVSVFGLGYVGCVTAACLADHGHDVTGVDLLETKVRLLNDGKATIVEEGIAELVRDVHAAGRLRATMSITEAVRTTDISLIAVGTPTLPNGSINLAHVERVCAEIGTAVRDKPARHTIVIRSTVLPGTTHEIVIPALERGSGKRAGRDFGVSMNPEFLREGTSIRDFRAPPFTIIGADDEQTARSVAALYEGLPGTVHTVETRVAEMLKYACNAYHGLKVGFANEIGNLCKALGVDSHEVMRLFCEDTKLNVSAAYLRPGFAFGGSCLPKDLRAVTYRARQLDIATPILSGTLESNERQIARAFDMVVGAGNKRVGILGLAFKEGTDDLRESPLVVLAERLIGKGYQVLIYDKQVIRARLVGSNREFIEQEIPHIWSLVRGEMADVLRESDTIVIGNPSKEFSGAEGMLRDGQIVIDLVRAFGARRSDGRAYEGICW